MVTADSNDGRVFVFGANLAGRHGKGAALFARQHRGAICGQGEGRQGQSYAIPTKDGRNGANLRDPTQTLHIDQIARFVARFVAYARQHPELRFQVTAIGCGLSGYRPEDIAPMFRNAPVNCDLPDEFVSLLPARRSLKESPFLTER